VNSSNAEASRECRFCSVNGPASRIPLAEIDNQFPIELLDIYKNWRNRFWFMAKGEIVSRRMVNCSPGVNVKVAFPIWRSGLMAPLNVVS